MFQILVLIFNIRLFYTFIAISRHLISYIILSNVFFSQGFIRNRTSLNIYICIYTYVFKRECGDKSEIYWKLNRQTGTLQHQLKLQPQADYIQINLSSALRFFQQTQSGLPVFRTIFYFKSTSYPYLQNTFRAAYIFVSEYLETKNLAQVDTELYHSVIKFPFPFLYCI